MQENIDLVALGLILAGTLILVTACRLKSFQDRLKGAWAERRTRRAIKRHLPGARLASGRILKLGETSTEIDLVVGTRTAIYLVETKYRNCRRITGGETEPRWTAHYGWGRRRHDFRNPLLQADRQRRFVIQLLDAKNTRCDVYRSVVIVAAGSIPDHLGVFDSPDQLAKWMAGHAKRRERAPTHIQSGWPAFETIVACSGHGARETFRHVLRLGRYRQALTYGATAIAAFTGAALIAIGSTLHFAASSPLEELASERATIAEVAANTGESPTRPIRATGTVTTDRCLDLTEAILTSSATGPVHFVRTGPTGRIFRRGPVSPTMVVNALAAIASNRRVESLLVSTIDDFDRSGITLAGQPVWLPCSGDGTRPLKHAIEGRLVGELATAPTSQSAINVIGVRHGSLATPVGGEHLRVDWMAMGAGNGR